MHLYAIPTCYFPSMVLFLDDGHDSLRALALQMDERMAFRVFAAPSDVLNYLRLYRYEFDAFRDKCQDEYRQAHVFFNQAACLDFAVLHAEVYNPQRFAEVSVLVFDWATQGMDGFEFCRRLENSHIKKIALIHSTDEVRAREALNAGLIDAYIEKNAPELGLLVKHQIRMLQHRYFVDMSVMVSRLLPIALPRCLQDKKFAAFFSEVREKHGIIEYYLMDKSGSFLMLDEYANVSVLIVKNKDDIQASCALAQMNGAPEALLDALALGEKIPGLKPFVAHAFVWSDWVDGLVVAQDVMTDERYAYALVPYHPEFTWPQKQIGSHHQYLHARDVEEWVAS